MDISNNRRSCYLQLFHNIPITKEEATSTLEQLPPFFRCKSKGNTGNNNSCIVELQRPNSNILTPRTFCTNGVFFASQQESFVHDNISSSVILSLNNGDDVLLWTYGMQHMGLNDSLQNLVEIILSNVTNTVTHNNYSNTNDDLQKVVLTLSVASAPGDDTDRIFDCLSLPIDIDTTDSNNNGGNSFPNLKIRQDPKDGFYLQDINEVIISNPSQTQKVLETAHNGMQQISNTFLPRLHTIYTCKIHNIYSNGETSTSFVQILNLSQMVRDHSASAVMGGGAPTTKNITKHQASRNVESSSVSKSTSISISRSSKRKAKEDKTLKAFHRILDALILTSKNNNNTKSNSTSSITAKKTNFVPYRDSKITRLIQRVISNKSTHIISVFGLFIDSNNYDEILSLCEFCTQTFSIPLGDEVDDHHPFNKRQRNPKEKILLLQQESQDLGKELEIMDDVMNLKSNDIELDMTSSMEMVRLREVLKEIEDLQVDPMIELEQKSKDWWKYYDKIYHPK